MRKMFLVKKNLRILNKMFDSKLDGSIIDDLFKQYGSDLCQQFILYANDEIVDKIIFYCADILSDDDYEQQKNCITRIRQVLYSSDSMNIHELFLESHKLQYLYLIKTGNLDSFFNASVTFAQCRKDVLRYQLIIKELIENTKIIINTVENIVTSAAARATAAFEPAEKKVKRSKRYREEQQPLTKKVTFAS
jgi:hypothetical protein